eukprot:UN32714
MHYHLIEGRPYGQTNNHYISFANVVIIAYLTGSNGIFIDEYWENILKSMTDWKKLRKYINIYTTSTKP